jgi:phosphohistidine phosphatase
MQVYLLRHGIAEDPRPGFPDAERALTADGKKKLRAILKFTRDVEVHPSLILTSPYRRAVETAKLAAEVLGYKGELIKTDVLTPDSRPEIVWDELRLHSDEAEVMITGHDPLFTRLTGYLLNCPNLEIDFKKGAMVRLDLDRFSAEPRGTLKWMLVPKLAQLI